MEGLYSMAEGVRFELTVGYKPTLVFKTSAFNRSASPPETFISIISIAYLLLLKLFVFMMSIHMLVCGTIAPENEAVRIPDYF